MRFKARGEQCGTSAAVQCRCVRPARRPAVHDMLARAPPAPPPVTRNLHPHNTQWTTKKTFEAVRAFLATGVYDPASGGGAGPFGLANMLVNGKPGPTTYFR